MSECDPNELHNIFFGFLKKGDIKSANEFRTKHPAYCPNLRGARFVSKDFHGINLAAIKIDGKDMGVNLVDSDLWGANLMGADFSGADCQEANFNHANLSRANLTSANFSGASLRSADFSNAIFDNTQLKNANLFHAKGLPPEVKEKYLSDLRKSLE